MAIDIFVAQRVLTLWIDLLAIFVGSFSARGVEMSQEKKLNATMMAKAMFIVSFFSY